MRRAIAIAVFTGLVAQAGLVFADDANSDRPIESHKQMMRDCMDRERAAKTGASTEDMKRICREKIKSYVNHPSETLPPPHNPG